MQCSKAQQLAEAKRLAKQLLEGWRDLAEQDIQVLWSSHQPDWV